MPVVEQISVALTAEQAASLRSVVASGEYATASEVVREALRDWQIKRELELEDTRRLSRLWQVGVESGSAGEIDMASLRDQARARAQRGTKAPFDGR